MGNYPSIKIPISVISITEVLSFLIKQQLGGKIMVNFNGQIFLGDNVTTIVNGRVISGGGTGKTKKFDERKSADVNTVERIVIDSTVANVDVSVSNSSKVEAHFYGQANVDGDIKFDVCVVNRELRITLKFTGNCYNGRLSLDVTVPQKTFKAIIAKSSSADITLSEGVSTDYVKVKTKSGDLNSNATFANASIATMSGDVELYIDAKENISVEISTMSGDVSAEFNNVGYIDLSTSSMSGDVRNRHKGATGYTANVEISTMSGDIRIR